MTQGGLISVAPWTCWTNFWEYSWPFWFEGVGLLFGRALGGVKLWEFSGRYNKMGGWRKLSLKNGRLSGKNWSLGRNSYFIVNHIHQMDLGFGCMTVKWYNHCNTNVLDLQPCKPAKPTHRTTGIKWMCFWNLFEDGHYYCFFFFFKLFPRRYNINNSLLTV